MPGRVGQRKEGDRMWKGTAGGGEEPVLTLPTPVEDHREDRHPPQHKEKLGSKAKRVSPAGRRLGCMYVRSSGRTHAALTSNPGAPASEFTPKRTTTEEVRLEADFMSCILYLN